MALTAAERAEEVDAATADVGSLARRVEVFSNEAFTDGSAVGAMWFPPRQKVDDPRVPAALADLMSATDHRDAHRLAVPAHPSDRVVFAGLVRHELEHARQFDEAGLAIFDIQGYLEDSVLPEVAGELDGCAGGLINSIPTEMDANAAASVYLAKRFDAEDLLRLRSSDRRYLACSLLPPAAPSTLLVRMAAFAVVHRAGVEAHAARTPFSAEAILGSVNAELGRLWKEWESRPESGRRSRVGRRSRTGAPARPKLDGLHSPLDHSSDRGLQNACTTLVPPTDIGSPSA